MVWFVGSTARCVWPPWLFLPGWASRLSPRAGRHHGRTFCSEAIGYFVASWAFCLLSFGKVPWGRYLPWPVRESSHSPCSSVYCRHMLPRQPIHDWQGKERKKRRRQRKLASSGHRPTALFTTDQRSQKKSPGRPGCLNRLFLVIPPTSADAGEITRGKRQRKKRRALQEKDGKIENMAF